MTDRDALLAAIVAAPGADLPRLVFADWLDDHGEPGRAAHLRAQVEVAKLVAADALDSDEYLAAVAAVDAVRPADLWASLAADGHPLPPADGPVARETVGDLDWVRVVTGSLVVGLRRGSAEVVRCRLGFWVEHGRRVADRAPVGRVEVIDRVPLREHREWMWHHPRCGWVGQDPSLLPPAVFERLDDHNGYVAVFPSPRAARDALSAACLAFARPPPDPTRV